MKVSKLARVLHVLRKPDAEVSFEEFKIRHPERTDEFLSGIYDYITHRAFCSGKPFHAEGFARERSIPGVETVSDRFMPKEQEGTENPLPKNYYPDGALWVKKREFEVLASPHFAPESIFAKDRKHAKAQLEGRRVRFLEPASDVYDKYLTTLRKSFSWINLRDSSMRVNMGRATPLMALAGVALLGYAGYNLKDEIMDQNKPLIVQHSIINKGAQVSNSVISQPIVPRETVPKQRVAVMPEVVSTNLPVVNKVLYESKEKAPIEVACSPRKSVVLEARKPYDKPQTPQVYKTAASMPTVKTNKLERAVSVPQKQKGSVVQNVQYSLKLAGKIIIEKEPMLVYSNTMARANEFPFIFSKEYEPSTLLVPSLVEQDGKVKRELDLSTSGIKAKRQNTIFPARGTKLITPNGLLCELDGKRFGTNEVYLFPRINGSFYAINSSGASLRSDSNRNVTLTSARGVYSTKPLARREYLERRVNHN